MNDVWKGDKRGARWREVSSDKYPKRFSPRRGHAATMDSKKVVMYVLGGFCGKSCDTRYLNDWWSSDGGDVWHNMADFSPAKWSPRHGHAAAVTSRDVLLVLGGHDGATYLNDVWYITDPSQLGTWEEATAAAPWSARYGHAAVLNSVDSIFVIGGFFADKSSGRIECFNDVWMSEDGGRTWAVATHHAPWSGRYQHAAVANGRDELFIVGGLDIDLQRCADTWRSKDSGQTWELVSEAAPWTARYEHAVVVDSNDSLYVLGGMSTGDEKFNDVWRSERTCYDNIHCHDESLVCKDGSAKHFEGRSNPVCVNMCDRRIFDECGDKEACVIQDRKAVCRDPCEGFECGKKEVCEVAPRHGTLPHTHDVLDKGTAFCLACDDAQTKFACDKLKQCTWSAGHEACLTKCVAMLSHEVCTSSSNEKRCKWDDGECVSKKTG